ncbi:endonuclease [Schinkia azotoformans]|uniref:endonuclease n=1 Tax=Schinkia azotoformans TaxID=1454 RepID=UPI002DBAED02|nr:endonuclease [Schinkia azotoformans]MEC1770232.1 endonuclease [Schinkia azotoformans]MED4365676.1 endonuclease [Schinkia azotoformans]
MESSKGLIKRGFSIICGKLLGDGCITKQQNRKPRFQFMHTISDYDWCFHCYKQLSPHIPVNPPKYKKAVDHRVSKGYTESYVVQSKTADIITFLHSIWYKERKKVVPFDFLNKYLNEEALAWWYQDDGHLKVDNDIPRKIILSTENFSNDEIEKLIKILEQKYSLYFSQDGQKRLLLYDQLQIYYFYRLIQQHIHPSMKRKMVEMEQKTENFSSKRTTIYLPTDISLTQPTFEINQKLNLSSKLLQFVENQEQYISLYKNYLLRFKNQETTKPYQIIIEEKHWAYINDIQKLTGLNNSQIVTLCFWVFNFPIPLMKNSL